MDHQYWHKQTTETPLFEDIMWSRPVNARLAGKLLILGGNAHGFSKVALAYQEATASGIGAARVFLPNSLQKTVGTLFPEAEFISSNPSGSFGRGTLNELLIASEWADGILLAGDMGHNSETAILLESFVTKYTDQLTLVGDSIDYFSSQPLAIFNRTKTTIVPTLAQLQALLKSLKFEKALTSSTDFLIIVEILNLLTTRYPIIIVLNQLNQVIVASAGSVSTTKLENIPRDIEIMVAARASVWWLQNPTKAFEALTSAVLIK